MLQAANNPAQLDTALLQAQPELHAAATPFWTATGSASDMGGTPSVKMSGAWPAASVPPNGMVAVPHSFANTTQAKLNNTLQRYRQSAISCQTSLTQKQPYVAYWVRCLAGSCCFRQQQRCRRAGCPSCTRQRKHPNTMSVATNHKNYKTSPYCTRTTTNALAAPTSTKEPAPSVKRSGAWPAAAASELPTTLPLWRPHSLAALSSHHQRPSRSCTAQSRACRESHYAHK